MQLLSSLGKIIHREGYIFIVIFAVVAVILGSFSSFLGWIGFIATCWCAYFFRNPDRYVPQGEDLVVAPADGVVQNISNMVPPSELGLGNKEMLKISIFLSVFNVHVNRVPSNGKILALHYNPGKFFNASLDKASKFNERQSILMETAKTKTKIAFVQIAGLIAKRIVCDLEEGTEVSVGERFGIIRFGSRVDVYLPVSSIPLVCTGQTIIGGETILADLAAKKIHPPKFELV